MSNLREKFANNVIIGIKLHAIYDIASEKLFFSIEQRNTVKYFL